MNWRKLLAFLVGLLLLVLTVEYALAYQLTTTYNPYTGKLDYITKYNSSDWGSGGGILPGSCPAGYVVQNTTNGGVQCVLNGGGTGDNTSWNQSFANTLYYPLSTNPLGFYNVTTLPPYPTPDNTSWNQTGYWSNASASFYPLKANPSGYYNVTTLPAYPTADNTSWNQSYANTLYCSVADNTSLWSNASSQQTTINALVSSNTTTNGRIDNINSSLIGNVTSITNLQNSNTSTNGRIDNLNSSLIGNVTRISNLESANTSTNGRIDNLNSSLIGNVTRISNLESSNTTTNGRVDNLNSSLIGNVTRISNLESANTTTNGRIDNLNSSLIGNVTRISNLESSNTTTNGRIDSLNATKLQNNTPANFTTVNATSIWSVNLNVSGTDIYIGTSKVCTSTNGLCSASVPTDAQFITVNITTKLNASSGANYVKGLNSTTTQCDYTTGKSMYNITTGQFDCGTDGGGSANINDTDIRPRNINFTGNITAGDKSIQYISTDDRLCIGTAVSDCSDSPNTRLLIGGDLDSYGNQTANNDQASYSGLSISTSRGTSPAPLANLNGDFIGGIRWYSYNGSDYLVDGTIRGYVANSSNNHSMNVIFSVTNDSSNTQTEYLRANISGLYLNTTKCPANNVLTTDTTTGQLKCVTDQTGGGGSVNGTDINPNNIVANGTINALGQLNEFGVETQTLQTYFCDFAVPYVTTMCYPNYLVTIATGTPTKATSDPVHLGILNFVNTVATNTGACVETDPSQFRLNGSEEFEIGMNWSAAILANNNSVVFAGFVDSTATQTAPTDGVYFYIVNGNLSARISNNSAMNMSATNLTLVRNSWYDMKIHINSTAGNANFLVYNYSTALGTGNPILVYNQTIVNTATNAIPTIAGRETGSGVCCGVTTAGFTAGTICQVDYIQAEVQTNRRPGLSA